MAFTDDLASEAKSKWPSLLIAGVLALVAFLSAVVWRDALSGVSKRVWSAIPKDTLGALLGMLVIALCASVLVALHYRWKLKESQAEKQKDATAPPRLETQPAYKFDRAKLRQALSDLESLKRHLPNAHVKEQIVIRYHGIIDNLKSETGYDLTNFRIPPSEIKHQEIKHPASKRISRFDQHKPAHSTWSEDRYCDKQIFHTAIDCAIGRLQLELAPAIDNGLEPPKTQDAHHEATDSYKPDELGLRIMELINRTQTLTSLMEFVVALEGDIMKIAPRLDKLLTYKFVTRVDEQTHSPLERSPYILTQKGLKYLKETPHYKSPDPTPQPYDPDETSTKILHLLSDPDLLHDALSLSQRLSLNVERVNFILEELVEQHYVIETQFMHGESEYSLNKKGRKFLMDKGLI